MHLRGVIISTELESAEMRTVHGTILRTQEAAEDCSRQKVYWEQLCGTEMEGIYEHL